ncbi:uncharacterized protein EI90DRAFT_3279168 [Cantharellus anzutake]|uniref:uncharacterized protein n=1 Tax=Cantharellus anzutake TaxID=1750568 RepID=UPI001907F3FC|nr:uncharacterized protein EI90DRAFT_3279168 [Cantharellus anzutake]KAF8340620.1 hypothetical protein EI90DRAFT_3279168 [Cantharellus anzutake]
MDDTLERQIFGGSDSELSSEVEDIPEQRYDDQPSFPPQLPSYPEDHEGSDADDEYKEEPRALPKFKKKQRDDDIEADHTEVPRRRKNKKNRIRREEEVEEEPIPEEKKEKDINDKIDALVKSTKVRGKKRKKDADEDVMDEAADAEVLRVKKAMEDAALSDQEHNKGGRPALRKFKMLGDVMEVLQKQSLLQSIIDHNFLEAIRLWLEPLSDKSLPALNIQRSLFEQLSKMFIDTNTLKDSGLGRIVLFYTKPNKRVSPQIRSQADNLIAQWSRPILKRSASYRDRHIPVAEADAPAGKRVGGVRLSAILAQGRVEDAGRVRKNAVRIPERTLANFTVAPRSNISGSVLSTGSPLTPAQKQLELERRRAQADKLRRVQRKLEANKQRAARML